MGWEERDTYGDNHAGDENGDIEARGHGGCGRKGKESGTRMVTITRGSILEIHKPQQEPNRVMVVSSGEEEA